MAGHEVRSGAMPADTDTRSPLRRALVPILVAAVLFGIGIVIRAWIAPARGLAGDTDVFAYWIHGIATDGWGHAYDREVSFPAAMAWIWGALAVLEPAFRTVTDAADPGISALLKLPSSLADLGIAAAVAWWFRDRPWAAVAAVGAVLLWPATWYVSAWWGQYEPVYVLPAVLAVLAARAGRPSLVAVLVAVSLMTKPQALPFIVPFAAWFLGSQGVRGTVKGAAIGLLTCLVLWLPFLPFNGPLNYLGNLREYQDTMFNSLSMRAWNPWWIVQQLGADGEFLMDSGAVLGPLSLRHLGFLLAGALAVVVFVSVLRRPTATRLALGLAAVTLVAFVALTTMHERYAYPAFIFLLMAAQTRWHVLVWGAFSVALLGNLVWAIPPPGLTLPALGGITVLGSGVVTLVAVVTLLWLERDESGAGGRAHVAATP
jgi:hypothetical protein